MPPKIRLVLLSFLMLFTELALIRWTGSNIVYLSYFSNFVLLGSFLGIGIGFLRGRARINLFPYAPVALMVLVAVALVLHTVEVRQTPATLVGAGFLAGKRRLVHVRGHDLDPQPQLLQKLPAGCIVDGEIVIATAKGLDFDALQLRLHPAASRVAKLSKEMPASFVAFDLLAQDGESLMTAPQRARRTALVSGPTARSNLSDFSRRGNTSRQRG